MKICFGRACFLSGAQNVLYHPIILFLFYAGANFFFYLILTETEPGSNDVIEFRSAKMVSASKKLFDGFL